MAHGNDGLLALLMFLGIRCVYIETHVSRDTVRRQGSRARGTGQFRACEHRDGNGNGGKGFVIVVQVVADVIVGIIVGIVGIGIGIGGELVVRFVVRGWLVCAIIGRVIYNVIRVVFVDHMIVVDTGHVVFQSDSLDSGNSGIRDGNDRPGTAVYASACGKGHKEVVPAGIARGVRGNGTEGAGFGVVGSTVVHLDVSTKFEGHGAVVGLWEPSDNGSR